MIIMNHKMHSMNRMFVLNFMVYYLYYLLDNKIIFPGVQILEKKKIARIL